MQNKANFEDFNISESNIKKIIALAIKGEIPLIVRNLSTSKDDPLNEDQLHEIHSHHPKIINLELGLKKGYFNGQTIMVPHKQPVNHQIIWFDGLIMKTLLEKYPHLLSKDDLANPPPTNFNDLFQQSPHFRNIAKALCVVIERFPDWRKTQGMVRKTGNLLVWVETETKITNIRDKNFIVKVLSDVYNLPN